MELMSRQRYCSPSTRAGVLPGELAAKGCNKVDRVGDRHVPVDEDDVGHPVLAGLKTSL
jgi:hypothetical protein